MMIMIIAQPVQHKVSSLESPNLSVPPLQLASAPAGKSSTPFQSLFPRDELGGAIANRQGIMGLA